MTLKLPSDVNAEQLVLGAILSNNDYLLKIKSFLNSEHFFISLHQKIYTAILTLHEESLPFSVGTVKSVLAKDELFIDAGIDYLAQLATMSTLVLNPVEYGKIIYHLAIKRNLMQVAQGIIENVEASTLDQSVFSYIEKIEKELFVLNSKQLNKKKFIPSEECSNLALRQIEKSIKHKGVLPGICTDIIQFDELLSGFQNSDLIIIAGRPAMGKTAFAINFAFNACKDLIKKESINGGIKGVGFFSLEMSSEQLTTRILSFMTQINSQNLRSGQIEEEEYNRLRKAADEFSQMPFFIDDTGALSISDICSRAKQLHRIHNIGILFIDYLQLLKGSKKTENRILEVGEITQGLKALAKELNIPIIALSQLSRAVEQREDKRPMLSDLRESGSIEQDADIVIFLYRAEYYLKNKDSLKGQNRSSKYLEWEDDVKKTRNKAEIIVAKHRNGETGSVVVQYKKSTFTILNQTEEDDET